MPQFTRVVDHAIVNVLIVKDDTFLLTQEGRPGRKGLYNLPGGHVEGHESLLQAAIREAKEETGYDVELVGFIGVYQSVFEHINVSGPVFTAKVVGGKAASSDEHPEVRWVTRDELHALAKAGKLFTKFPPIAVDHYVARGSYPLDTVTCLSFV